MGANNTIRVNRALLPSYKIAMIKKDQEGNNTNESKVN